MKKGFNAADKVLLLAFAVFLSALAIDFSCRSLWSAWLLFVAEASLVGGIADWFAVTALFSKPLGFPWHTAILPSHRQEFTEATVKMIKREFLSRRKLFAIIREESWQGALVDRLFNKEMREELTGTLVKLLGGFLRSMDLEVAESAVAQSIRRQLWQLTPRQAVEHIKESLNNGGNQALFAALGRYTEAVIDDPGFEARVSDQLCKMVERGETNPLMAMMKGFANMMGIANYDEAAHLIRVRLGNIAAALQDGDSRLQQDLSAILSDALERLSFDEQFCHDFRAVSDEVIARLPVEKAVEQVFSDFRADVSSVASLKQSEIIRLLPDCDRPAESSAAGERLPVPTANIAAILSRLAPELVESFLTALRNEPATASLLFDMGGRTALKARELAGSIAREVMGGLSDDDLNALVYDKIEPDLLWIRMNGSIVGAVIGFFMFILLEVIPMAVK
ncbi:MAG: DUF445 family protein [Selenomonadaceae bacterium]|nr:DUF445 family protein [Selenomonadaceae bacterium]